MYGSRFESHIHSYAVGLLFEGSKAIEQVQFKNAIFRCHTEGVALPHGPLGNKVSISESSGEKIQNNRSVQLLVTS